ncbi:MAG: glycosyltransferase [Pseudomonadota bacterium]
MTLFVPSDAQPANVPVPVSLAATADRPFWSVMIPVYNADEAYLRETLASVLSQDPGVADMQIEVIDNCSTVRPPDAVVRDIGGDRIRLHRQPQNVGMAGNFNECVRRARGRWVHILHADDTVRPGFYAHLRQIIESHPGISAALCRTLYMDLEGQWIGLSELESRAPGLLDEGFASRQLVDQRIQFASIVVARETYERLGGFRGTLSHCMDWDMWKRVAMHGTLGYVPEPLACYRLHPSSDSSRIMRSGANVREERRSIRLSCAELPPEEAGRLARAARRAAGVRAARRARTLWREGDRVAAWRQVMEALRCSWAPGVVARSLLFVATTIVH